MLDAEKGLDFWLGSDDFKNSQLGARSLYIVAVVGEMAVKVFRPCREGLRNAAGLVVSSVVEDIRAGTASNEPPLLFFLVPSEMSLSFFSWGPRKDPKLEGH